MYVPLLCASILSILRNFHWLDQSFRDYVRLNCNYGTKIRKKNRYRGKIPPNIILKAVRAMKILIYPTNRVKI